jgi:hypothetical protein
MFALEHANFLNYGSSKAEQPGFALSSLSLLAQVKSFDKR